MNMNKISMKNIEIIYVSHESEKINLTRDENMNSSL